MRGYRASRTPMPAPPKELEWVRFTQVIGWLHRAHQCVGVAYALLTAVSLAALALAGASAFLVSPYNHVMPVPRMVSTVHDLAAKVGVNLDRPLAPAASLANVPIPPPAGPMIRPKYVEPSRKEQLAELLRLHGDVAHVEPVAPAPPSDSTAPLREAKSVGASGDAPADRARRARGYSGCGLSTGSCVRAGRLRAARARGAP